MSHRTRVSALDVLRGTLISYCQDRYRVSPDADAMKNIISYVDAEIQGISEAEASEML